MKKINNNHLQHERTAAQGEIRGDGFSDAVNEAGKPCVTDANVKDVLSGRSIKLIALDMDGTLLMSDKTIHPETPRDIAAAAARGIHVVYCTGRDISELESYVPRLPDMRYGICTSGSIVYDFRERRSIFRHAIPRDVIREAVTIIGEKTGMVHFLGDGISIVCGEQMERMEDYHMEVYRELYRKVATPVESMLEELENHESIPKMNIYFRSEQERDDAREKVKHLPLTFATAEKTSLEMTAPGVSKAHGLQELAAYLGISVEETAGVGDADNDRAVLKAVGLSVAMGNAEEDILGMCDLVTDDNEHNGVGKVIRAIVASQT